MTRSLLTLYSHVLTELFSQKIVARARRETLESVSSCTRFSGILKISNFGFNRLRSKLVGMFVGIVPMFVLKDFVQDCFVAQICAKMCVRAVIRAYLLAARRSNPKQNPWVRTLELSQRTC